MDNPHFNRAMKRAQSIKDELTNLEPDHLSSFLEGICEIEPPKYRHVNGKIQPELVMVKRKDNTFTYDLGNIYYNELDMIQHVELWIVNGAFRVRRSEELPRDEGNFLSIPIYRFIAQDMVSLYKVKHQRISEYMDYINDRRRMAYNLPIQKVRLSVNGKVSPTMFFHFSTRSNGSST